MSGFIALHRDAFSHPLLKDDARFRAWFWLVAHAAWKPTKHDARGTTITIDRGQICAGREFLAKEWGWSPSAVERFLTRLETEQMIERTTGQIKTVITICNYDKYQDFSDGAGHMSGQETGQKPDRNRTTKEQGNKGTRVIEDTDVSPITARGACKPDPFPCPNGVDPVDWAAIIANRKAKRAPLTEGAHRQIVRKLDGWANAGWPPGPIVAAAAERGWTSVFETDEMKVGKNGGTIRTGGNQGPRGSSLIRAIDAGLSALG